MSDGGAGFLCWLANSAFLQCVNRSSLKTSCMAHPSESFSLYAPCPISSLTVKGPYLFWSSFFEGQFVWMFLASSHTCSPVLRPCDWHVLLSYCFFIVFFVLSITVFASSLIVSIFFSRPSKLGVTNFIQSYLHQFFNYSHGLKASLKPLRWSFNRCQSHLEAINNGRDIKQINW